MAAPSQKQLKTKILALAKRKQQIDQPGRLVAHVVNELRLTSNSTIREPIVAALESLEEEKLIIIGRTGTVMSSMQYVEPTVVEAPPAPASKPTARQRPAAVKQPADQLPFPTPPQRIKAGLSTEPSVTDVARRTASTKAATPAAQQSPVVASAPAASERGSDDGSLFKRLVEKAESLKSELVASQQLTTEANAALDTIEQELAAAVAALAQANADKAALVGELTAARDALNESSDMHELLIIENRRLSDANTGLEAKVGAYQHLEARALSLLND